MKKNKHGKSILYSLLDTIIFQKVELARQEEEPSYLTNIGKYWLLINWLLFTWTE